MIDTVSNRLFAWTMAQRNAVVKGFFILYSILIAILVISSASIFSNADSWGNWYEVGTKSGELAVIFYVFSTLPGIMRRLAVRHKIAMILMTFRRYTGIASYLFILVHASIVRISPVFSGFVPMFPLENNIIAGMAASGLLFVLFITSNDLSVRKLGIWWDRIHDLTYWIVWIILIHVALNSLSVWTFLTGSTALLQVYSHVAYRFRRQV